MASVAGASLGAAGYPAAAGLPEVRIRQRASRMSLLACGTLWALTSCATPPAAGSRPTTSSLGCIRQTVWSHDCVSCNDKYRHCLAAGMTARHCSVAEAYLASWGKEAQDALGAGDSDRRDLRADFEGIRCAHAARDDNALRTCCAATYPEHAADPGKQ